MEVDPGIAVIVFFLGIVVAIIIVIFLERKNYKQKKVTIIVRPSRMGPDYKAFIKDNSAHWSRGKTRTMAIGELMRTCPEEFGIIIEDIGGKNIQAD